MVNIGRRSIAGLLAVLLVIQGFSLLDLFPFQIQKVYANSTFSASNLSTKAPVVKAKAPVKKIINSAGFHKKLSKALTNSISDKSICNPNILSASISMTDVATAAITPVFSPESGTYSTEQTVILSSSTTGSAIYYTIDGSDPTTGSAIYLSPLTISKTTTVKAIAVKEGMIASETASANYIIQNSAAPSAPTNVTLLSTSSSSITVSWNASTGDVTIANYDIYDGSTLISSVQGDVTTCTINGLHANTSYVISVKARDKSGNQSEASNSITVKTLLLTPSSIRYSQTDNSITLNWGQNKGNLALSKLYIKSDKPEDEYPDNNERETTDDIIAKEYSDGNSYGYKVPINTTKSVDVTIDLGDISTINNIKVHKWEGSNNYGADKISIYTSQDGVNYEYAGNPNKIGGIWLDLSFPDVDARYVKVNFSKYNDGSWGNDWLFIDEIQVYNNVTAEDTNLALGKSYIKSEQPEGDYSDNSNQESTDGILAGDYYDHKSYGYKIPVKTTKSVDVTLDLGGVLSVNDVKVHKWEGSINYGADTISVYASQDGENYQSVGSLNKTEDIWRDLSFPTIKAHFIKVNFSKYNDGGWGNDWLFIDEIQVYNSQTTTDGAITYEVEADGTVFDNGTSTTFTHGNLESNSEHTYRIRSKNASGFSAWSDIVEKYTLLPAPVNLAAIPSSTSMELSWDIVEGATGYEVEVYGNAVDNGNSTSYVHTGLEPNSQRIYRVRAKNSNGVSEWSDLIAATTLPGTAFNIQTKASDNSIKVFWNAQAGASSYEIEIDDQQTIELTDNRYLHEGLITNSQHQYRVRSKNKDGISSWSETVTGVVLPTVPADFHVITVSGSAIELGWNEVTGATGYDIEVDGKVIDNALNNTYLHTELKPNEEHTYRVRARNGAVTGEWSQELRKTTLLPAPANLKADASGSQINLKWDMVIGADYYEVEIDGKIVKTESGTEYIHSGVTAGAAYTCRVRAVNGNGYGEWSNAVTRAGLLGIPPNIMTASQSNSIKISWNEVTGASAYDVMVDGKITNSVEGLSYEYAGLTPNSRHVFRVRAVNEVCTGEWSDPRSVYTRVGIPSNVKASAKSTEIAVTWDEVDGADSYDISVDGKIINNGVNTTYKHSGLNYNSEHSYKVRAKNVNGEGQWSDVTAQLTGPAVPSNLKGEAGINQITLTWGKPEGAVSYEVEADGEVISDILTESYTSQGLEPNTRHEYIVRSKNNKGVYSEWSEMLEINTTEELTINVEKDAGFNFVIAVPKKEGIDSYDIVVSYDATDVEVLDLYAATQKAELQAEKIEGTNITVKQFSEGKIVYGVSGADKPIMAIIRFISKTNSQTNISYIVE